MLVQAPLTLSQFISKSASAGTWNEGILAFKIAHSTPAMQANSYYFGHLEWSRNYLEACHQYPEFKDRWQAVIGSWQNKIVVDIGCGPGNLYASLRDRCGTPQLLIGVDISKGALKIAQELGYMPVLADAQQLPFISGFADIVTVNATIHHCDDMGKVLSEAARLVRPGGLLITDHDPQKTAWRNNLIGWLSWNARLPLYRLLRRGGHATAAEQFWSTATEAHHRPGDGVAPDLFHQILEPLGFAVQLYPHNRAVGAEIFRGARGRAEWKLRLIQRLSGINPDSPEAAMLLMCVATR
ncbi:MAG TPA: class I SAM-dependent methyltransferase [Trichocoleus sp.]|jgi:ubiquinone/menaquinone biosynthesis C-methylase UbiE